MVLTFKTMYNTVVIAPPVGFVCLQCLQPFSRPAKVVNFYERHGKSRIKFCSVKCRGKYQSIQSEKERSEILFRICAWCKIEQKIDQFAKKDKNNRNSYVCKTCMRAYCKSHYSKYRDKAIARAGKNRPNYTTPRYEYIKNLKNVPCADCGGVFHYCAMDFDHLDGETKDRNISTMRNLSWNRIKLEISKCEVVCSNCHRIRTYNRLHTPG